MISWTLCWTRLGFIVFDNQRVSIQRCPHLCPSTKKNCIFVKIYIWATFYRNTWSVPPCLTSSWSMEFHAISRWISSQFSKIHFLLDFNPNSSLAPAWRVCSVLLSPGLLVTLNQCQWSQKCLNIFPSRTMLQFTGYVPLISTQWHHKIFSLITETTIFIIHWMPVICEH